MCIILDANCFNEYLNNKPDMKPVRKWVEDKGKIVFSEEKQIKKEVEHYREMSALFNTYNASGKIKKLNKEKVENYMKVLGKEKGLKSNDIHLLAHAKVGKVTLIVTRDKKLQQDFINIIKGKVYRIAEHKHLLQEVECS